MNAPFHRLALLVVCLLLIPLGAPAQSPTPPLTSREHITRGISTFFASEMEEHRTAELKKMRLLLDDLRRSIQLDPERLHRLEIAAAGATERTMRSWKKNLDSYLTSRTKDATASTIDGILNSMKNHSRSGDSPAKNNVWITALSDVLTPAERSAWDLHKTERQSYQEQALTDLFLAELQLHIGLDAEQTQRLAPLATKAIHDYLPDFARQDDNNLSFEMIPLFLKAIPESQAQAIVKPPQWERFKTHLGENLGNWDDLAEEHAERIKRDEEAKKKAETQLSKPAP